METLTIETPRGSFSGSDITLRLGSVFVKFDAHLVVPPFVPFCTFPLSGVKWDGVTLRLADGINLNQMGSNSLTSCRLFHLINKSIQGFYCRRCDLLSFLDQWGRFHLPPICGAFY